MRRGWREHEEGGRRARCALQRELREHLHGLSDCTREGRGEHGHEQRCHGEGKSGHATTTHQQNRQVSNTRCTGTALDTAIAAGRGRVCDDAPDAPRLDVAGFHCCSDCSSTMQLGSMYWCRTRCRICNTGGLMGKSGGSALHTTMEHTRGTTCQPRTRTHAAASGRSTTGTGSAQADHTCPTRGCKRAHSLHDSVDGRGAQHTYMRIVNTVPPWPTTPTSQNSCGDVPRSDALGTNRLRSAMCAALGFTLQHYGQGCAHAVRDD